MSQSSTPDASTAANAAAGCRRCILSDVPATLTTLAVQHVTTYRYAHPVELAQQRAVASPSSYPWQSVHAHGIVVHPGPAHQHMRTDAFGNGVLHFMLDVLHEEMSVSATSLVTLMPRWEGFDAARSMPWEAAAQCLRFTAGQPFHRETEFVYASPNVALHPDLRAYALQSFGPGVTVAAGAIDLMHRIHADFAYRSETTEVHTPALEAFALRSGVCQDFAQVMIGCLRSLGLAARYVSGYLLTDPPPGEARLLGADASHAWAGVWCPVLGWIDLDPTNDVLADTRHVTLAMARDYSDIPLLHGVIVGGGEHEVAVQVSVVPQT
ncbi:transglutaminase family protein [Cupriavidus pauculus]|uniref:Transglutaminase family protein n=1 Tax=Cupriavidus pauculus TaxID=82633 RepID=A0A5P2H502_9BURK|nr:transglutaminase family protein [Cupriavidus pauculus]QET03121.1 transglutaminase family protein [Cupriavidus pauculus]